MGTSETSYFERQCARISRQPQLTEEQERSLAKRWLEQKDRKAAEALVEAHLPLVVHLANRLRGYGVAKDELVAEGNVGLLRAVEKFDLRGVRFKTYATYWIRAHMLAYAMRSNSIVTVATGALGAKFFFKLRSARAKAEALLGPGHEGIDALLAKQFGVGEEVIRQHSARLASSDLSLDVRVNEDGETTALDLLPTGDATPEEALGASERDELVHQVVQRLWKALDERERTVLRYRLMADEDDVTLADLGDRFQLSRERLRQIEVRVKQRLKRALETAAHDEPAFVQ
ncbi:MAG: sigma-70 family RNA polymerase sigma factor [Myxococcaceae bacterium]|nr:sigma-70 family RNA polymerase sigma factor [Myxococcaceae bacterium]MCA3013306.1 sigma-70 family RNA polymerase sigma factor [Myxococcaceae bacterium]